MATPSLTTSRAGITQFGKLTSPEAARTKQALLILPVGALEQHGDGLPLSTDTVRADHVAEAVAQRLGGQAFVLPSLPYGVSPHHASFAGTVTLAPRLFIELVSSVVASLAESGWSRILIITGHGGNNAALGVVQQELLYSHPGLHLAWSPVSALAVTTTHSLEKSEVSGHSGESETAQMLAIDPQAVDRESLNPGALTLEELSPRARLSRTRPPTAAVRFEEYAANGVLGDPRTSTAEKGEEILEEVVAILAEYGRDMLELPEEALF